MSELQAHYDMMRSGCWATSNADECPCHGRGFALSEVDTWHKCPVHFEGQLHPEACEGFEDESDYLAAEEESKAAFKKFQAARSASTFHGNFDTYCSMLQSEARKAAARFAPTLPAPAEEPSDSDEIPF
jgi:hypothetical protein